MNTTMKPTKSTILRPIQKTRRNSPLRRPGAILASLRQKSFPASLHESAWPSLPAGSDGPAPKRENTEPGGKMPKNPPASDQKTALSDSAPARSGIPARDKVYWTIQKAPTPDEIREALKLGPNRIEDPLARLRPFRFGTVRKLMTHLHTLGESLGSLEKSGACFAQCILTSTGVSVDLHDYATAVQLDRTRKLYYQLQAIEAETAIIKAAIASTTNKARMGSEVKL